MINDEILENRLNAFRDGKELPKETIQTETEDLTEDETLSFIYKIFLNALDILYDLIKTIAFGYSAKTIFLTNWEFWPTIAVGFSITIILNTLTNIFKK